MSTLAQVTRRCARRPRSATNGTGVFTAEDFCTLYLATCTGTDAAAGYTTRASCEQMFGAVTTQAHCRSYHLCNADAQTAAATITMHCGHATGINLCATSIDASATSTKKAPRPHRPGAFFISGGLV